MLKILERSSVCEDLQDTILNLSDFVIRILYLYPRFDFCSAAIWELYAIYSRFLQLMGQD